MNKHVAWITGAGLATALSVSLIAPALAYETTTTTVQTPPAPIVSTSPSDVPVVTTGDFPPKSVPVVTVPAADTKVPAAPVKATEPKTVRVATVRKVSAPKSTAPAAKPTATAPKTSSASTSASSGSANTAAASAASDLEEAQAVLRSLQAKYKYLDGAYVTVGTTPGNYQAVTYYHSGHIVLSPNHTASIARIMNHEIWHIIDYRDNGKIDWGERVAPANAADYLK